MYDHYSSLNLFNFFTLFVPVKNNHFFLETCSLHPCDARLLFFSLLLWIVLSFLFSALWPCLSAIFTLHTLHFPSFYTLQENSFILMASAFASKSISRPFLFYPSPISPSAYWPVSLEWVTFTQTQPVHMYLNGKMSLNRPTESCHWEGPLRSSHPMSSQWRW